MPGLGRPRKTNKATAGSALSSSTKPSKVDSKPTMVASTTMKTPAKILTIPQELRDIIYEYVYKSDSRLVFVTDKGLESAVTLRPFTPPLRLVCKQLSNESLEPFLKFSIFYDHQPEVCPSPMRRWLATTSIKLHEKIRTIRVHRSTVESNDMKDAMLEDRWCRMFEDMGIKPEAYQTTFTSPCGTAVWAAEMPDGYKLDDCNGERRRRPAVVTDRVIVDHFEE